MPDLPLTGGWLPDSVGKNVNWWQLGYDPIGISSQSAMVEACVSAYSQTVAMCPGTHWRLKSDGGWLQVVGLFWLKDGANTFGTDAGNRIVLPAGSAPARAGVFELRGGKTTVRMDPGVEATVDGKPAGTRELRPDVPGPADVLKLGPRLTLHVIERGGRYGIRLKDRQSALLKEFTGLRWFPVQEDYRVEGRFVPYASAKTIAVPNILGQVEEMPSPGYVAFTIGGLYLLFAA